jgi:hypothetical protein
MLAPTELVLDAGDKTREIELSTNLATPSVLDDIWLRPLGLVLRSRWQRSEKTQTEPPRAHSALRGRDIRLSISASFDATLEREVAWCRRKGGASINRWHIAAEACQ